MTVILHVKTQSSAMSKYRVKLFGLSPIHCRQHSCLRFCLLLGVALLLARPLHAGFPPLLWKSPHSVSLYLSQVAQGQVSFFSNKDSDKASKNGFADYLSTYNKEMHLELGVFGAWREERMRQINAMQRLFDANKRDPWKDDEFTRLVEIVGHFEHLHHSLISELENGFIVFNKFALASTEELSKEYEESMIRAFGIVGEMRLLMKSNSLP